ncbi:MAG: glycoside hydrolase family 3 C-terminal domain-containing protein [Treponema sp.]|jgi:beta-glucosidase|nr:glycoside hydrolase family 3 C-terminal domain-containing protein [Treponema sp.]
MMKAEEILAQLTVGEKASLCSGLDYWKLKAIPRLGIGNVMVSDGPHGLRKQAGASDNLGNNESVPATCFPAACATASSFDPSLLAEIGGAMAEEALKEEVSVILGPGVNIKRSPLCGRNFEYFSEDPYVAGELASAMIGGIQEKGVGTSLKHYAANNQELARLICDSVVDERALREIYLAAFERAVKQAAPWTIMCSYNVINGTYASEHRELLTTILREEWGFKGLVMSDWGATADRPTGIAAGMDLEMPGSGPYNDKQIVKALRRGSLSEADLDKPALRIIELIQKSQKTLEAHKGCSFSSDAHHALARKAAAQSAVLLKNEGGSLPLAAGKTVAVIGAFAKTPRFQGGGSSKINPFKVDSPLEALLEAGVPAEYAPGYTLGAVTGWISGVVKQEADEEALIREAVELAAKKDIALVFAGLPDEYESEGYDRKSLDMPDAHNRLIEAVAGANPNTLVVLMTGSPVSLPWADRVKAILLAYLGGEAVGGALADLLTGAVNPSGKLAETWPLSLADTPAYRYFPGVRTVEYRESVFVGYRYYDTAGKAVAYPLGFGLSYTSFEYSGLSLSRSSFKPGDSVRATITLKNTGAREGAETVQLYVEAGEPAIFRPQKELRGFEKVFLKAGESRSVSFSLDERSFAYYNLPARTWAIEGGEYRVLIGASSRDIRLKAAIQVEGDGKEALLAGLREKAPDYYALKPARDTVPRELAPGGLDIGAASFEAVLGRPIPQAEPQGGRGPGAFSINTSFEDIKDTFIGRLLWKFLNKEIDRRFPGAEAEARQIAVDTVSYSPIRGLHMAISSITGGHIAFLVKLLNIGRGHAPSGKLHE